MIFEKNSHFGVLVWKEPDQDLYTFFAESACITLCRNFSGQGTVRYEKWVNCDVLLSEILDSRFILKFALCARTMTIQIRE